MRDLLDEIATRHPGLLNKFGGHAMAAGLSMAEVDLEEFQKHFLDTLNNIPDQALFEAMVETDGSVEEKDMNLFTAQLLRDAMPWGQQFPEPVFDGEFYVKNMKAMGERHIRLELASQKDSKSLFEAVLFNTEAGQWLMDAPEKVYVVYKLGINDFRSAQRLQLIIQYMQGV